ncbi:cysteine hydrolase family protein [Exiguobacterium qingdaonense]|uniref:cysteine hydrolase family protein n=1 Tax=Exiguobacterium qingdaonense TaxID=2751251 RepID=UPI001BE63BFA|nr:isochorismatase family cysteine hydrolase [Exiguobacterium qingdaonense]
MSKTALLIIDLFNDFDFEGGDMLRKHTKMIIEPILELKKHFKETDLPVIYCNDNFGQWKDSTEDIIDYVKASKGKQIALQIEPADEEYFIIKPRHSIFFGTQLDILLRQLNVTKLILTGVATDICILFSANDAYMRNYDLYIPRDCVAAETVKRHESALTIIDEALGIETSPVSEYLNHVQ